MDKALTAEDVRRIEKQTRRPIVVAQPAEYQQTRVGRYDVPTPVFRIKVQGVNRWLRYKGGMVQ